MCFNINILFDVFIIKKESKNNRYTNSSFEYVYYCNLLYDLGHQTIKKNANQGGDSTTIIVTTLMVFQNRGMTQRYSNCYINRQ